MPPQEGSQNLSLTDGSSGEPKAEPMKAASVDTAVDIGDEANDEFKGLTKEELMKYSQDPFWKKLRVFLMFLFWGGWLVMLVLAILIIVKAPQCEPPPTLKWLQESPLLEVDIDTNPIADIATLMTSLGLTSFYLPSLISDRDYKRLETISANNVEATIVAAMEELSRQKLKGVTDYVPNPVHRSHVWAMNSSYEGLLTSDYHLNYGEERLPEELQDVFAFWKSNYNITGFLVPDAELTDNPDAVNVTADINMNMTDQDIVLGTTSVDMSGALLQLDQPGAFKDFVMGIEDWHYFKFNPIGAPHLPNTQPRMTCVTLTMMLLPDTPLMQVEDMKVFQETLGDLVKSCVDLRSKEAMKFGDLHFANSTDDNVIAFTRTRKSTPGYAVVVNLGNGVDNSTVVDMTNMGLVPESGNIQYSISGKFPVGDKTSLANIEVDAHDGVVIQFVAE